MILKFPTATLQLVQRDNLRLLRIPFSLYLMPVFLFALSQAQSVRWTETVSAFFIIHLLVYPASNGYNSYIDRDKGSIGGLKSPPQPHASLFHLTLVLDILAVVFSAIIIGSFFAACVLLYIFASRAYSAPSVRLKSKPWAGFVTVVLFQGGLVYYMSYLAITGETVSVTRPTVLVLLAVIAQIAAAYPLTQVFQHEEDRARGDETLSMILGTVGTFLFSAAMFVLCGLLYFLYFRWKQQLESFVMIQLFLFPAVLYFVRWYRRVIVDDSHADWSSAMDMNAIAAMGMNACFLTLFIVKSVL